MTDNTQHPRLIDYICIVGLGKNDVGSGTLQQHKQPLTSGVLQPKLLRQYPDKDHEVRHSFYYKACFLIERLTIFFFCGIVPLGIDNLINVQSVHTTHRSYVYFVCSPMLVLIVATEQRSLIAEQCKGSRKK